MNNLNVQYLRAVDNDGRLVNFVADVDFSGKCEHPFSLPLRTRLLWDTARVVDLYNRFPDVDETIVASRSIVRNRDFSGEGMLVDAVVEAVKLQCGRCRYCADLRKQRWKRAVEGFLAGADLTLFYTLTFSDAYFNHRISNASTPLYDEYMRNLSGLKGAREAAEQRRAFFEAQLRECVGYDALNKDHDAESRAFMCEDRQKMMKLLRYHLSAGRFHGAKLIGQMSVYEYGDTRGRLHLHGLMHFTLPKGVDSGEVFRELKEFIIDDWVSRGIGKEFAQDVQLYEQGTGSSTAAYCLNYLLKYETMAEGKRVTKSRARLACSKGYRKLGTIAYYAAYPKLVPGGSLREVTPREVSDISMKAAAKSEDWRYGDDVIMAVASQPAWAKLEPKQRDLALALARAAMIWNDGELGPAEYMEESDDREFPPEPFGIGEWVEDQLRDDIVGKKYYPAALIDESGADVDVGK